MRLLILGAGGHAQVVADAVTAGAPANGLELIGYLDDDPARLGEDLGGVRVLGPLAARPAMPHDGVVVAIGSNARRAAIFDVLGRDGETLVTVSHPSAIIAASVVIGAGTMICAGVIVNPHASIGRNVILNTGCSIDHHGRVEDHAHIAPGARLGGNVTVGRGTLVGIGAVVLPGVSIGAGAVVGGGSVVVRDVADGDTVAGNPARPLAGTTSRSNGPHQ